MRSMKNPSFTKQPHADTGTFPLTQFSAKFHKQSLNILPFDIATDWP